MSLKPETLALLDQARGQLDPNDADRDACRAALAQTLGAGALGAAVALNSSAASAAATTTAPSLLSKLWALPALKPTLGLLAIGGATAAGHALTQDAPSAAQQARRAISAQSSATTASNVASPQLELLPAEPEPGATTRPDAQASATPSIEPIQRPSTSRRRARSMDSPRESLTARSLKAELRALHEARASLDKQDPGGALDALHQVPNNSQELSVERRGLSLVARCQQDPAAHAQSARAFLREHDTSPVAHRVRRACRLK